MDVRNGVRSDQDLAAGVTDVGNEGYVDDKNEVRKEVGKVITALHLLARMHILIPGCPKRRPPSTSLIVNMFK